MGFFFPLVQSGLVLVLFLIEPLIVIPESILFWNKLVGGIVSPDLIGGQLSEST